MNTIFLLLFTLLTANAAEYTLHSSVKDGASVKFHEFEGPGAFDSYLSMNLPFAPMKELFQQVVASENIQLTTRGEAHITVITPVEYWNLIRPYGVTMDEINKIARTRNIQFSKFEVICLGLGAIVINDHLEKTFYVVVSSNDLIQIREQVQKLLVSKGGNGSGFDPLAFYPHITLGFTKRDLHESDGIIKNEASCVSSITVIP
jgi:hypothetical protein